MVDGPVNDHAPLKGFGPAVVALPEPKDEEGSPNQWGGTHSGHNALWKGETPREFAQDLSETSAPRGESAG